QPMTLPLEQPLLQRPEDQRVETLPALPRRLNQDVEVRVRYARGQLRQLGGIEIRELRDGAIAGGRGDELLARSFLGKRYVDRRHVRIARQSIAQIGELLVDHHKR